MGRMLIFASGLSVTAAGLLAVMLVIAVSSGGVTQQKFEFVFALDAYTQSFTAARPVILHTLIFDNLFIIAYVGALALGFTALAEPGTRIAAGLAAGGIVAAGLLDYAENLHFLTMYATLDAGGALTLDSLGWRMWASLMKWHIAYAALVLGSFVLVADGLVSWVLVWSLRAVLPVAGVLLYAGPEELRPLLSIARYGLMFTGFILFAIVFAERANRTR